MRKLALLALLVLGINGLVWAQGSPDTFGGVGLESNSLHSQHVAFVAGLYWTYLGRQPDADGFKFWVRQMDDGKTEASTREAFATSAEFGGKSVRPCAADYAHRTDYATALAQPHLELITISVLLGQRNLIGRDLPEMTAWYGNVYRVDDANCSYQLWFDFTPLTIMDANSLALHQGQGADVTYDPISGLATSIVKR
jgi:hypothetical protein